MYDNIYSPSESMKLGMELVGLNQMVQSQEVTIEELRLKAAFYKANFFHDWDLVQILQCQIEENLNARVGEFDGVGYASWR